MKNEKKEKNKRGGSKVKKVFIIVIILIVAAIILYFVFGKGLGFGGGEGSGENSVSYSDSSVKTSDNPDETSSSPDEGENSPIVIRVSENEIYFGETLCADTEELKAKITENSEGKEYVFQDDSAIKSTYDEVEQLLSELKESLKIIVVEQDVVQTETQSMEELSSAE